MNYFIREKIILKKIFEKILTRNYVIRQIWTTFVEVLPSAFFAKYWLCLVYKLSMTNTNDNGDILLWKLKILKILKILRIICFTVTSGIYGTAFEKAKNGIKMRTLSASLPLRVAYEWKKEICNFESFVISGRCFCPFFREFWKFSSHFWAPAARKSCHWDVRK